MIVIQQKRCMEQRWGLVKLSQTTKFHFPFAKFIVALQRSVFHCALILVLNLIFVFLQHGINLKNKKIMLDSCHKK